MYSVGFNLIGDYFHDIFRIGYSSAFFRDDLLVKIGYLHDVSECFMNCIIPV